MKRFFLVGMLGFVTAQADSMVHPKYGFPLYTNIPPGPQMSGQWVAARTPALSPEEERKSFHLPPGFQARLFAAEPDVANPVAMTWDERGRLWVLELYEYPLGAQPGTKGRDRIKILEDTDNDGLVDKVTVFADGFSLATGLLLGNGGVYVGEAPHLWYLEDTNGDGVADRKTEVLTGFGLEDRHELLNGFTWGPDGQLYLTHGVFTKSQAVTPGVGGQPPVLITAGVARWNPKTHRAEVFAEGTSNPWGVDFDGHGNAFVSACVIDHFFHLAPGGIYARQAGQPPYPYGYELLPSIVQHRHHMAAYAGVCIYQGDQWPSEWRGEALMGNIHQNALNHDHLEVDGSSFQAKPREDFLTTTDGWFMPVSSQVGPDGALWVMDWYDKYPCYQNANADPQGVDRERGRIWRIVWVGDQPDRKVPSHVEGLDFARLSTAEILPHLGNSNVWQRRMAQRVLSGRTDVGTQQESLRIRVRDSQAPVESRLAAFWSLFSTGLIQESDLNEAATDTQAALRVWSARFTGERRVSTEATLSRLTRLAGDPEPTVRSATATACRQWVSGQLTINAPVPDGQSVEEPSAVLAALVEHSGDRPDPTLDFLIWTASEPVIVAHPKAALGWFQEHGVAHMPLAGLLVSKTVRRLCDADDPALLNQIAAFIQTLPDSAAPLTQRALDGWIEAQRGHPRLPTQGTGPLIARLIQNSDPGVAARGQTLGALWGDTTALQHLVDRIQDSTATESSRREAIRTIKAGRTDQAFQALSGLITSKAPDALRQDAIRALSEFGNPKTPGLLLASWDGLTPASRRSTAELLASKTDWASALLAAVADGRVKRGDIPPTAVRTLAGNRDASIQEATRKVFGRIQATPTEKLKLIDEKRRMVRSGAVDLEAGHEIARKTCFVCHKLYGEGAEVGPDLTGVGRSSLDALLHNVINPNEIIGQGYENVEVETKDGRTLSGRMVENSESRVRLVMAGPQEEIIAKSDVLRIQVSENSVMPEGLEQMPDADFRNLIWYILAPPQDGKPLTPERRKELSGGDQAADGIPAVLPPETDGEAVALWAPDWKVETARGDGVPVKYPEWRGKKNVLAIRPFDSRTPAAVVRNYVPPVSGTVRLKFAVAAESGSAWELQILCDGEVIKRKTIENRDDQWTLIDLNLTPWAGRRVIVRLEGAAIRGAMPATYWADLRLEEGNGFRSAGR